MRINFRLTNLVVIAVIAFFAVVFVEGANAAVCTVDYNGDPKTNVCGVFDGEQSENSGELRYTISIDPNEQIYTGYRYVMVVYEYKGGVNGAQGLANGGNGMICLHQVDLSSIVDVPQVKPCNWSSLLSGEYNIDLYISEFLQSGTAGPAQPYVKLASSTIIVENGRTELGYPQIIEMERLSDGRFRVTVQGGSYMYLWTLRVRGIYGTWGSWPSQHYSCSPESSSIDFSGSNIGINPNARHTVICSFNLPPRPSDSNASPPYPASATHYQLQLIWKHRVGNVNFNDVAHSYPFSVGAAEILSVDNLGGSNPNSFSISVGRFNSSISPNLVLYIRNTQAGDPALKTCPVSFSSVPDIEDFRCDFSGVSPGAHTLVLSQSPGVPEPPYDTATINIRPTASGHSCTCAMSPASFTCGGSTPTIVDNNCYAPAVPSMSCSEDTILGAVCSCSCSGDPSLPIAGTRPLPDLDLSNFTNWMRMISFTLIAIGVASSVFLLPYGLVLMATGNQQNIEKGQQVIKHLFTGLALLLLGGTIIRLVGTSIFGFGGP